MFCKLVYANEEVGFNHLVLAVDRLVLTHFRYVVIARMNLQSGINLSNFLLDSFMR